MTEKKTIDRLTAEDIFNGTSNGAQQLTTHLTSELGVGLALLLRAKTIIHSTLRLIHSGDNAFLFTTCMRKWGACCLRQCKANMSMPIDQQEQPLTAHTANGAV